MVGDFAPATATKMSLYVTIKDAGNGEVFTASWPCLLDMWHLGNREIFGYIIDNLPDYLLDADVEIDWPVVRPLWQFVNVQRPKSRMLPLTSKVGITRER
jgi:hypothetical protein